MARHESGFRSHCQGCGAPLAGPYCAQCGQHDVDYNRSFWHVAEDALEGFLHYDGKFLRSARYLFTRPGFLTREFIAGHRAQYTNPVRFYFFASFLFFALSALMGPGGAKRATPVLATAVTAPATQGSALLAVGRAPGSAENQSWLDEPLRIQSDSLDQGALKELKAEIWHLLPPLLFVCLPLLALVLKGVYFRSGRLYLEHVIFALHLQALAFLSFLLVKAGGLLASLWGKNAENIVGTVLMLGLFALIFRAFRTVYGQGRLKTAGKILLTLGVYGTILLVVLLKIVTATSEVLSRHP